MSFHTFGKTQTSTPATPGTDELTYYGEATTKRLASVDDAGSVNRYASYDVQAAVSIGADQNDYNPAGFGKTTIYAITPTGTNRAITGFLASARGDNLLIVRNTSSTLTLTLTHESTSSAAANRIAGPNAADVGLGENGTAVLVYDTVATRWRIISTAGSVAVRVGYGLTFGGAVNGVGKYAAANGHAAAVQFPTLDVESEFIAPKAGTMKHLSWHTDTGDTSTVLKVWKNGAVVETVTLTGVKGVVTTLSTSLAAGDRVAVEYDAGTAPGKMTATVYIE